MAKVLRRPHMLQRTVGSLATSPRPATDFPMFPPRPNKATGDISSIFPSLSGIKAAPLDQSFADLKREIVADHGPALQASWDRLLPELQTELAAVARAGPSVRTPSRPAVPR